ncbi:hypothetical protein LEMLEM_LOCUS18371 [Lemmus lemmus]
MYMSKQTQECGKSTGFLLPLIYLLLCLPWMCATTTSLCWGFCVWEAASYQLTQPARDRSSLIYFQHQSSCPVCSVLISTTS